MIRQAGGNARIFGSVASAHDGEDSDIDLLVTMKKPVSLMTLSKLARQLSDVVGYPVDLIPEADLRPDLRQRIVAEAVPL
jgi:predicted nucleotidyltransferase